MGGYVHPTEQLVTEIVVRDIRRSASFYRALGFELLRDGGDFMELTWEDHRLFLAELSAFRDINGADLPARPALPMANIRVMVPNVDDYWKLANEIGAPVIVPIADRYHGLRDSLCDKLAVAVGRERRPMTASPVRNARACRRTAA